MLTEQLTKIKKRFSELRELLSDPNVINDRKQYPLLHKEYKELNSLVSCIEEYENNKKALENNFYLSKTEQDPDFLELATEERNTLEKDKKAIEQRLKTLLVPKDPNDDKNIILELRAGTGGDEAGIWTGDLMRMYTRFAERKKWKLAVLSFTPSSSGGYKEIILHIEAAGAYKWLKYESGIHRVQRVPATETQGRKHTSVASVAVMPEVDPVEVDIDMSEIKKETFCSSGPGGQSVNTTYSAIRLTHIPTGITASCQEGKSQIKNFEKALKVLRARLYKKASKEQQAQITATRKSMIGSGDRSDKIRTYNYSQARVTDHRINYSQHNLNMVLDGDLDNLIEVLHLTETKDSLQHSTDL